MSETSTRPPARVAARPASIAVFVGILLVTAVIALLVGFGTDGAPAIEVGDRTVTRDELNDELRQWAEFAPAEARATRGAVTGEVGAGIATQVVYELLAEEWLDRNGEKVTAEDREQAREAVADVRSQFEARPRWWQDRYLDRRAVYNALSRLVGQDDEFTEELRVLRREARRAGVRVDPAYGRWAPARLQVVPYPTPFTPAPAGPFSPSGA